MKYVYPAIFRVDKDDPKWINVSFPDIVGGVTCGAGKEDAMYMAKDVLKLMLTDAKDQCFPPHTLEETEANFPGEKIVMVEVEI